MHLKGYQKYDKFKLKVHFSLNEFRCLYFDLSYFLVLLVFLEVQGHTLPHWKALSSGKYEPKG